MSFVHLHVHTHYSILDGMSKISALVDKCLQNNMPAIAITDHGSMFGIKEFLDYVDKKNGGYKGEIKKLKETLKEKSKEEATPEQEEEVKQLTQQIEEVQQKCFKPIVGVEAYCARRSLTKKELKEDGSGWHLVLLAKNKKGYQNLCKLVSKSWIDGYYYRPRIDKELLEQYSEGLIVSSACLGGEIPQKIMQENIEGAEEAIMWFKNIWGDDFYLEVQRHETYKPNADQTTYEKQKAVNEVIFQLAEKTNTKVIATNDVHFVEEEHAEAHDHLICLSTSADLHDSKRMRYTKQEWLKTPEQMAEIFSDHPEILTNTLEIAQKVEVYSIDSPPLMPKFDIPTEFGTEEEYRQKYTEQQLFDEFTQDEKGNVVLSQEKAEKKVETLGGYDKLYRIKLEADYLAKLAWEGAAKRYGEITEEIRERINFELYIMKTMGFPGYFLIVQDFIQAARNMGVSVGPGRGSAAGSVVAYCLKITDINPLEYDLLFERFLNPDRISLPDIDIDFDDDGRASVLQWVTEKYGKEKVAHIITYGTMATKSSIKDVGRVQGVPLKDVIELTKMVPDKFGEKEMDKTTQKIPKVNLTNCFKYVPELREKRFSADKAISDTLKYAEMLEGTVRQTGVHACGVIIGADDLTKFAPLSTAKEKGTDEDLLVTQYEGSVIESVGLIKMDFLGLKTLSIIKEAISNIRKSRNEDLDIDAIPKDDALTYQLFGEGKTIGTFQFESPGMQKHLKELKPTTFEDLIAMNALYRPGPMDYIPQFIARKHGKEPIEYDIPDMEVYLKDTYGITVYQEQVMLLSRLLADFTRGESDNLRKAMGKKLRDKLDQMKPDFISRGSAKGHDPVILDKIWKDWEKFASYAFNKSHATCYSWVAYQTAYLKAHYPAEFMAANLTRNKDDIAEVSKFMNECSKMGIKVLEPDVNESELNFTVNTQGNIRFGLGGIKGVGEGAVEAIVKEREQNGKFTSIYNFVERVNLSACNKKTIENLILAGAFDCFDNFEREQMFEFNAKDESVLELMVRYGNKYQQDQSMQQNTLFGDIGMGAAITKPELPKTEKWSIIERLNKEKECIGMYISSHPLDEYKVVFQQVCNTTTAQLSSGLESFYGKKIIFGGMVTDAWDAVSSKTGKPFGKMVLNDYTGSYELAFFSKDYIDFNKFLAKNLYLLVVATVQKKGEDWKFYKPKPGEPVEYQIKVNKIYPLSETNLSTLVKQVTIQLPYQNVDGIMIDNLMAIIKNNKEKGTIPIWLQLYDKHQEHIRIDALCQLDQLELNNEQYEALVQAQNHEDFTFTIERKI